MLVDVEKIIRKHIDKTIHLSLATVANDKPWVCEIHFAYDEDLNLYFRSRRSRRHSQEIEQNPSVAGNIIDKFGIEDSVVGIYFEGRAELLEDGEARNLAARCLIKRLEIKTDILGDAKKLGGHPIYKIIVKEWSIFGDFDDNGKQKHSLEWASV